MFWWKQEYSEFTASAEIRSTELRIRFALAERLNGSMSVMKRWQRSPRVLKLISLANWPCAPEAAAQETCTSSMVSTTVIGAAFLSLLLRLRSRATRSAADTFKRLIRSISSHNAVITANWSLNLSRCHACSKSRSKMQLHGAALLYLLFRAM